MCTCYIECELLLLLDLHFKFALNNGYGCYVYPLTELHTWLRFFKVKIVKQIHRIELSCHWTLAGHLCIIKKHVELYCRARELDPKNYITAPFFASQFLNLWHLPFVLWKVQLCTRVTFKHNHQRIWRKLDYCLNLKGQFSIHCSYRSCLAWGCYRQPNRGASHCHDKDMNLHWLQTT